MGFPLFMFILVLVAFLLPKMTLGIVLAFWILVGGQIRGGLSGAFATWFAFFLTAVLGCVAGFSLYLGPLW